MTSDATRRRAIIEQKKLVQSLTPAEERALEQELSVLDTKQLEVRLGDARTSAENAGRTAAGLPRRNTKRP